jgi:hypothetical protein
MLRHHAALVSGKLTAFHRGSTYRHRKSLCLGPRNEEGTPKLRPKADIEQVQSEKKLYTLP